MALTGILADLEQGWSKSVAFVVPPGTTWPLPLYELALMTADRVWGMNMDSVDLHLVTPELSPLAIFGAEASDEVSSLLAAAGITPHVGISAAVSKSGLVGLGPDRPPLEVDRIVALPLLDGPRVDGVPCDARGFIPVDDFGRVTGAPDVYAAGDATNQPIKQGGLACQQADAVAAHIVAAAGADITPEPAHLVLRGRLLTGRQDRFLRREAGDPSGTAASEPLWWPPAKVSSRYLAPYLTDRDLLTLPPYDDHDEGISVCIPVAWNEHNREDVLGLKSLG
jgi:sulfide:quinone oxidoreductase